jgi:hypothetical protein
MSYAALILTMSLTALPPYLPLSFNDVGFCEGYGVHETSAYFSDTVYAKGLGYNQLQIACSDAVTLVGSVHGCALYRIEGQRPVTRIFWLDGRYCAMVHEWCHAANMSWHTEEFIQRLNSGDKTPACPLQRKQK